MKIAAVVIGLFVAGLAYLSYRGWVDVKWVAMEDASRSTLTNATEQIVNALNNTGNTICIASVCCCGIRTTNGCGVWVCARTNDGIEEGLKPVRRNKMMIKINCVALVFLMSRGLFE